MDVDSSAEAGFQDFARCEMERPRPSPPPPDLSRCPWYHGPTTRIASEMSLARDMDFLVRDCISSPGDYVLTTRWRGQGGARLDRKRQLATYDGVKSSNNICLSVMMK